jgi:hypothetical protein
MTKLEMLRLLRGTESDRAQLLAALQEDGSVLESLSVDEILETRKAFPLNLPQPEIINIAITPELQSFADALRERNK